MKISTQELLENLEKVHPNGLEVSCRMGVLSITRAIFMKNAKIYIFAMEDKFQFQKDSGYSKEEFLQEYCTYYWLIENTIN